MLALDRTQSTVALAAFKNLAGWPSHGGCDEVIEEIAQSAADENFPGAILPRFHEGKLIYYGVAPTARLWRELQPLLNAFSGPTLTNFTGMAAELRKDDKVESFLLSLGLHAVARLVPSDATARVASFSLRRMRLLLAQSQSRERSLPESTSQVLNSFRKALAIPDPNSARRCLQRLRGEFRLDALNVRFLEIQMCTVLGEWKEILLKPYFVSLCKTRRPKALTIALIEALYRVHIAPVEGTSDPSTLVRLFRSAVLPVCGQLFEFLPDGLPVEAFKMFTLEALASSPSQHGRLTQLKAVTESGPQPEFDQFWTRMGISLPQESRVPQDPESRFRGLIASKIAPGVESARAALVYAFESGVIENCRLVVKCIDSMNETDRETLFSYGPTRRLWTCILEETGGPGAPGNWLEWFQRIDDPSFTEAFNVAERFSAEWSLESMLNDPVTAEPLAKAINSISEGLPCQRFAQSLPLFILCLKADPSFPNRIALAVYENLLEFFALHPLRGREDLFTINWLMDGVLLLGTDATRYRRVLDAVGMVAGEAAGLRSLDWFLDLMELVIIHPCPEPETRDQFLYVLIAQLTPFAGRLSLSQIGTLSAITRLLDWEAEALGSLATTMESPPAVLPDNPLLELSGKLVAFYSLTESVGRTVGDVLRTIVPLVRFIWNGDHVGTDRLRSLTREADVFVIMTQSAKHAATEFIQMHRRDKPVLYPRGRGSSSVLRALEGFCGKD